MDLSDIVTDPDLAEDYLIIRSVGQFAEGGWQETKRQISGWGVVTVARAQELQQVPEGDRVMGAMIFYSSQELFSTHGPDVNQQSGTSDILVWLNVQYRILNAWPYGNRGYWKAYAVRMAGL